MPTNVIRSRNLSDIAIQCIVHVAHNDTCICNVIYVKLDNSVVDVDVTGCHVKPGNVLCIAGRAIDDGAVICICCRRSTVEISLNCITTIAIVFYSKIRVGKNCFRRRKQGSPSNQAGEGLHCRQNENFFAKMVCVWTAGIQGYSKIDVVLGKAASLHLLTFQSLLPSNKSAFQILLISRFDFWYFAYNLIVLLYQSLVFFWQTAILDALGIQLGPQTDLFFWPDLRLASIRRLKLAYL